MIFPPDLSPEVIHAALSTKCFGHSLDVRMATGSTNEETRLAALAGEPHGHVIVSDRQTHGRGTRGRVWSSPAGTDLYFSILTREKYPSDTLGLLTLAVGLGVTKALRPHAAPHLAIKWPNDIWLSGKKCGGILVESRSVGSDLDSVVIGVGINVNRLDFEPELQPIATSLRTEGGETLDRAQLLADLLKGIEAETDRLQSAQSDAVVAEVGDLLFGVGEYATCDGHAGVIRGLDEQGSLLLMDGERQHIIRNGTLSFESGFRLSDKQGSSA